MPSDVNLRIGDASVSDEAYRALRSAIVAGIFRPGDVLRETDLVRQMNVSRTPVRAALQRLAADGIVQINPRRGASVRRLTIDEARELHEVRRMLEGQTAEYAALRADPAAVVALVPATQESSGPGGPTPRSLLINQSFHEGVARLAGNRHLEDMVRNTIDLISLWRMDVLDAGTKFRGTAKEHERILDAIRARDPVAARKGMEDHLDASWKTSRARLQPRMSTKGQSSEN